MEIYNFTDLDTELYALEQMSDLCACVCYNVDFKQEAETAIREWWECEMAPAIYCRID